MAFSNLLSNIIYLDTQSKETKKKIKTIGRKQREEKGNGKVFGQLLATTKMSLGFQSFLKMFVSGNFNNIEITKNNTLDISMKNNKRKKSRRKIHQILISRR